MKNPFDWFNSQNQNGQHDLKSYSTGNKPVVDFTSVVREKEGDSQYGEYPQNSMKLIQFGMVYLDVKARIKDFGKEKPNSMPKS